MKLILLVSIISKLLYYHKPVRLNSSADSFHGIKNMKISYTLCKCVKLRKIEYKLKTVQTCTFMDHNMNPRVNEGLLQIIIIKTLNRVESVGKQA